MKAALISTLCFAVVALSTLSAQAPAVLAPADFTYQGFREVRFDSLTSYMRGLSHRMINGDLRFLSLTHTGVLREFSIAGVPLGGLVSTVTASWKIPGAKDHSGIWFNQATNRLWITSSTDYTADTNPAHITMMTLGPDGTVSNVKTVKLAGVNEKRVYGGCQPSPLPQFYAVCGWGGYTSLVNQGGGAAMGPFMVGIADPDLAADGATIPAKRLLDTPGDARGLRKTTPLNYFDGGDADTRGTRRENPQTPPTLPPYKGAGWLSPDSKGLNWFVWGDSYYNNAAYIQTPAKRGFVAIAALCQGKCWYQTSTLHFDGRTQELHIWDPSRLTAGLLTRPDAMSELVLPRGIKGSWDGNVPMANISGVTYVRETGTLYAVGYPLGAPRNGPDGEWDTGRLYSIAVAQ
ncbi:MAG: hypothetical protein ABI634_02785 [Acidobacteriota bacterium]